MTAKGQFHVGVLNIGNVLFGMVAKQNAKALHFGKAGKHLGVRFVFLFVDPGGKTADAESTVFCAVVVQKDRARLPDARARFP